MAEHMGADQLTSRYKSSLNFPLPHAELLAMGTAASPSCGDPDHASTAGEVCGHGESWEGTGSLPVPQRCVSPAVPYQRIRDGVWWLQGLWWTWGSSGAACH